MAYLSPEFLGLLESAAAEFLEPTDAVLAAILADETSVFSAAISQKIAAEVTVPEPTVGNVAGPYAARPIASGVPVGTVYYATDVPEQYRSDGVAWVVVGSAGNELGHAQSSTVFSNGSTTPTDVTGMTTTFVVGERPVEFRFDGDFTHTVAGGIVVFYLVLDGVVLARPNAPAHSANYWATLSRRVRKSGLTPGTTHTVKLQIAAIGGTGRVQGDGENPMSISVVTL